MLSYFEAKEERSFNASADSGRFEFYPGVSATASAADGSGLRRGTQWAGGAGGFELRGGRSDAAGSEYAGDEWPGVCQDAARQQGESVDEGDDGDYGGRQLVYLSSTGVWRG